MFTKSAGAVVDGLNASGDVLDQVAVYNLPVGGLIPLGQVFMRDYSQLVSVATQGGNASLPANANNPGPFVAQSDIGILPNAPANVGDVLGVYQGQLFGLSLGTAPFSKPLNALRKLGIGWVYAGVAVGGTSISVGSLLIAAATQYAVVGARAFGVNVGRVTAYPVNTATATAVAAGAGIVVPVASAFGINATTVLTIDVGATAEVATPTAISYGTFATGTVTIAGAPGVNVITTTVGGIVSVANVTGADTATTAAAKVVAGLNASAAAAGSGPIVQLATNTAGVVTIVALNPGTAGSAITLTTVVTGAGGTTAVASGATLAGGVQPTITVALQFAHALGTVIQGVTKTGVLVAAPTAGIFALPVVADINTLL